MNLVPLLEAVQDQSRQLFREMAQLRSELVLLRTALERTSRQSEVTVDLIALAHAATRGRVFSAAGLVARALETDMIGEQLARQIQRQSVRSIGRRLASLADKPTGDGLVLSRVGDDRDGALWRVCTIKPAALIAANVEA